MCVFMIENLDMVDAQGLGEDLAVLLRRSSEPDSSYSVLASVDRVARFCSKARVKRLPIAQVSNLPKEQQILQSCSQSARPWNPMLQQDSVLHNV